MDAKANELLMQFSNAANKGVLHPLDERRFYKFTVHVHLSKLKIAGNEVRALLVKENWPAVRAEELAARYERFLEILAYYDEVRGG